MSKLLEFEKPIIYLKEKSKELTKIAADSEIDLSEEISSVAKRLATLEDDIYGNLRPWDRVQLARHQERPTTLDYIDALFENFIEFHGDRLFGDDPWFVSGIAA